MRRRMLEIGLEVAVPIALLALWAALSANSGSFYFPPLSDILAKFRDIWLFDRMGSDVLPSLRRLLLGYGLAIVLAVSVGLALGLSERARRATSPMLEFCRAIPPPALLPFAILIVGVGDSMKVFIIALTCLWPILLNTVDGVTGVDSLYDETSKVYGVRPADRIRKVVVPAALPQIFAGLRTSLSLALILMVVSEMVASTNGIGYFVLQSQRTFAIPEMWSGILLLGILGYTLNLALMFIERGALRWHRASRGSALS